MKRVQIPFFSKFINLKLDIPVKIDNSQFFVRMDIDKKYDLVYFYIISKVNKKLDETIISQIDQAYKDYLNNYTALHIWNIKRIFYLLRKLASSQVFDFEKMKRIDFVTTNSSTITTSSSSVHDQITNNIARTIKQNRKIITIINENELKNPSISILLNFHYLNFQLLNALIGIGTTIIFNLPTLLTVFNCILNEKAFDSFLKCFNEGSSDIVYMNYILS